MMDLVDCELIALDTSTLVQGRIGSNRRIIGGVQSGGAVTNFITSGVEGHWEIRGMDLTNIAGVVVSGGTAIILEMSNCAMPASWTLLNTAFSQIGNRLTAIGCSDTTGKSSGATFQDFIQETFEGTVELETTAVRTGGSNDGATGLWGWKITPRVDKTRESILSVESPWMSGFVAGDASTTFTFKVYIANSLAESSPTNDYHEDDVSVELLFPSAAGTAQHDQDQGLHSTNIIPGSTTAIASDASTWGSGAANGQVITITGVPDFSGPFYARVHFWKTFSSSPDTLYVDPKVEVTS